MEKPKLIMSLSDPVYQALSGYSEDGLARIEGVNFSVQLIPNSDGILTLEIFLDDLDRAITFSF